MAEMSAADVVALTKENEDGFGGVGWIILLFIFLLAIGGGNGFLGGNGTSATQATLATGDLYSALGSQDLKNDVRSGFAAVSNGQFGISKDILENRFTNQLGLQNLGTQMQNCCCDIKTTIITENQATRDLIQANYISGLQTALSDAKNVISNKTQNEYLLGQLGKFYSNPPSCGCSSCSY